MSAVAGRVAIVFPGDLANWHASAPSPRLTPVFTALAGLGLAAAPVPYAAARADEARGRLLAADAILAWVDPVPAVRDQRQLHHPVPARSRAAAGPRHRAGGRGRPDRPVNQPKPG